MELQTQLADSCYQEVSVLNREHHVYLVRHRESQQLYVKKELSVYDPAVYEYLLQNPIEGLPKIMELQPSDAGLIVIEEYIPGISLEEFLEKNGPMTEQLAAAVLDKICAILGRMHSLNSPMIHRDIKPTNVIIKVSGAANANDIDVVLIDMNAAKYASNKESDTRLLGTKGYAAPEQYGFGSSNVQTDVCALGKLLNTLLWGGYSNEINPGRFSEVIRTCTELSPEHRYQSAAELQAALRAVMKDKHSKRTFGWMRFLPPGFRQGKVIHMLIALAGYFVIFYLCLTLKVQHSTPRELTIEKAGSLIGFLMVVLCSCNYLGIRNRISFCNSEKMPLKILGVMLLDLIVLSCAFMVTLIVVVIAG